ncbi:MAG: hypothetical protein ACTSPL_04235 [Candidatus Odinarchaeia archaeon]
MEYVFSKEDVRLLYTAFCYSKDMLAEWLNDELNVGEMDVYAKLKLGDNYVVLFFRESVIVVKTVSEEEFKKL